MTDQLAQSFQYEHCDVPDGLSLSQWRTVRQSQRRAQVTGGLFAAVATLAPIALSLRGSRHRRG